MFDLRSALVTAITALNIQYVLTKVFDKSSDEKALMDLEKCVFEDSAIIIGDWVHEGEAFARGFNYVRNEIHLLVCAKSATAKAALNDTLNQVKVGLLRNRLGADWLTTDELSRSELRYTENERVHYYILALDIWALETATEAETLTHQPTVIIASPTAGQEITLDGATDLEVGVTYQVGDYDISSISYAVHRLNTNAGDYSFFGTNSTITGGTDTFTWAAPPAACVTGSETYTIDVIIIDAGGQSGTATRSITITKG